MTTQEHVYRIASVLRVTDGDSYWFYLDIGFRDTGLRNIRLLGYDCPERTKGTAYERGQAKYATGPDPDDFGRWLGEVWAEGSDGTKRYLGEYLRSLGLASVWPTRWHEEYDR